MAPGNDAGRCRAVPSRCAAPLPGGSGQSGRRRTAQARGLAPIHGFERPRFSGHDGQQSPPVQPPSAPCARLATARNASLVSPSRNTPRSTRRRKKKNNRLHVSTSASFRDGRAGHRVSSRRPRVEDAPRKTYSVPRHLYEAQGCAPGGASPTFLARQGRAFGDPASPASARSATRPPVWGRLVTKKKTPPLTEEEPQDRQAGPLRGNPAPKPEPVQAARWLCRWRWIMRTSGRYSRRMLSVPGAPARMPASTAAEIHGANGLHHPAIPFSSITTDAVTVRRRPCGPPHAVLPGADRRRCAPAVSGPDRPPVLLPAPPAVDGKGGAWKLERHGCARQGAQPRVRHYSTARRRHARVRSPRRWCRAVPRLITCPFRGAIRPSRRRFSTMAVRPDHRGRAGGKLTWPMDVVRASSRLAREMMWGPRTGRIHVPRKAASACIDPA